MGFFGRRQKWTFSRRAWEKEGASQRTSVCPWQQLDAAFFYFHSCDCVVLCPIDPWCHTASWRYSATGWHCNNCAERPHSLSLLVQRGASSFWPSRTMTAPHTQQWKVSLFRPALSVLSGRLPPSCAFASNLQEPFLLHAFQLQVSVTSMFGLVCIGGASLLVFAIQDKLFGVVGRPLTSGQWRVLVLLCQQLWPWSRCPGLWFAQPHAFPS